MPRPRLNPSEEQRRLVKSMAAVGVPHEDIARKIGIRSPKTLRRHFREELDLGMIDANYNVGKTLYEMATGGDEVAATIFWVKTRKLFREPPAERTGPAGPPPPIIVVSESEDPGDDQA
jgi:hypothetical protein